jgi:iron complex outermembrane recepter protein
MDNNKLFRHLAILAMLSAAILFLQGDSELQAQTKQILQWSSDLSYLKNASSEELEANRAVVLHIRNGVELWLKMHPDTKTELQPAPAQPWEGDDLRNQVSALGTAIAAILQEDPSRPFDMGMTLVSVTAEASPLSPVADTSNRDEIVNRQALTAAAALDYLPGVAIDHQIAGRNEASIRLRGFTVKGQIPLYIDGIQVTMPYDGTIDFNRILANDIAEVQVSKGFSSPLLGPNAMGGSINIVTRNPQKKAQGDLVLGTGSGDMSLASVNLGSRWEKFYVQGNFDWLQSHHMPISGKFKLNNFESDYKRNNSDTQDAKYSGRFGFTPKGEDEYVFSYSDQKSKKGVPIYAGPNSAATFNPFSFRRWPYWDKTSYYLITNTALGVSSTMKLRAYYDQFQNEFDFYDNANFNTMNKTTSNHSTYDDHSDGASAEFTTRKLARNLVSASFSFRDDNHKEILEYPARSFTTPWQLLRAQTFSFGFQDVFLLTEQLRATFGFSADHNKGVQIQIRSKDEKSIIPVICKSDPNNTSFSGCAADSWNYNPQASLSYSFTSSDSLYFTFSDRGRFPLLKDSYSFKLGTGIANPDLKPEHNTSFNIGYSHAFPGKTLAQIEYYYNRLRDAIQSIYFKDPGGTTAPLCNNTGTTAGYCSMMVNVARESHQGFEFSLRSTPFSRLTLDANYSYLNRTMAYDFGGDINPADVLTSVLILPVYPKNKAIFNATMRLPHEILAIGSYRYEGGIVLQDTTYRTAPANLPWSTSYGTVDLGTVVPIMAGFSLQAGVKNLLDRNYYYAAGFPEAGRNWYVNMRYSF